MTSSAGGSGVADAGSWTSNASPTSRRSARARAWSIARLIAMRCSQGRSGRRRSKRFSRPERREKGLLRDVLRRRGVVDDEVGGLVQPRPVTVEQRLDRLGAARLRRAHQRRVRAFPNLRMTHGATERES